MQEEASPVVARGGLAFMKQRAFAILRQAPRYQSTPYPRTSSVVKIETILKEFELPPQSRWRSTARYAFWALVVLYFVFAAAVLALRYWILPNVGAYSSDIERSVSRALGLRVAIGTIEAGWQGLRPELFLGNVTVHDRDGRAALSLPTVEATFAWTSILIGSPRFFSLAFDRPKLEIRRDAAGKFYIAGLELSTQDQNGDTARWVLSQRKITVRDAGVTWIDEQRGAPPLSLSEVNLELTDGHIHRFALRAKGPAEFASTLDVRGELRGGDLEELSKWTGQFYAELPYTNLVAWQPWFNYPLTLYSGKGGVRLWLSFAENTLKEVTADVALSQVATRVADDLPLLELDYLQGRLGARQGTGKGFEVFGRKVTLRTRGGVALAPADFSVRWEAAEGPAPAKGGIEANALELAPLANLAEYLPFPSSARARLVATEPRGSLQNLKFTWIGDLDSPQHYSLRGSFSKLAARAINGIPGFAGLTGRIDATEKGGGAVLGSEQLEIELPGIVAENAVQLDSLTGRINWKLASDRFELDFNNLSFANRDLAGILFGSFASSKEGSAGIVDLTGNFSRVDGRAVYRYIPWLPKQVVDYLKTSIRAGQSNDVKLRLKGDLAKFPFEDPASGTFQAIAKVDNAEFRYAEDWPQAGGMSGELIFAGKSLRIVPSQASVLGVRTSGVRVSIPDLFNGDEHVQVDLRAESRTGDFLRFIAQSPVTKFLDGFTEGMRATGTGRLALQLDIPIRRAEQFKLSGSYQFVDNQVRMDADAPAFSHANGRLEFTDAGVSSSGLTCQFLGGPATISLATRSDGVIVANARGTVDVAQFPRSWDGALLRRVSGGTAWRGTATGAPGRPTTLSVQSQLTGISADLPAPFGKAAEDPMPLRIERTSGAGSRAGDSIKVSLGDSVKALIERRRGGEQYVLERGVISVNEPAVLPDRAGLSVTGNLKYVDVDRWRALLGGDDFGTSSLSLNLQAAVLDVSGRRLNDVALRAGTSGNVWVANVVAKELAGEIAWRPEGQGRIVARLKHFSMPESAPDKKEDVPVRDLPAVDIIADNLFVNGNNLGRLELIAINQALDWRIEKLVLTGPESVMSAEGVWQNWVQRPNIDIRVKLDVKDIGKYLDRMGSPRTVQRGTARLEGALSWAGSPQAIDFPTLSGELALNADKGQFLKAEPGAAKLLGILSMQSWITLDFRELFGKGFAFESISSRATLANGVLTARYFHMRGPSAQVDMSGQVDLAHETQNLRARVVPPLSNPVILGMAVVNPIAGLWALLAERVLKDPLGQIFAVEYEVTGTWDAPQVKRLKVETNTTDVGSANIPR